MKEEIVYTFEKVYEDESDAIFRFCLIRVSNRDQALDITQETFLRLWQSFLEDKDIVNCRAFLFAVARNLIIDWYRKKKSLSLDALTENEEGMYGVSDKSTQESFELGVEGRQLIEKINLLSAGYRDPIYLRFVEGLSPEEIGEIVGISANAASVRINRGLAELRKKAGYNSVAEK